MAALSPEDIDAIQVEAPESGQNQPRSLAPAFSPDQIDSIAPAPMPVISTKMRGVRTAEGGPAIDLRDQATSPIETATAAVREGLSLPEKGGRALVAAVADAGSAAGGDSTLKNITALGKEARSFPENFPDRVAVEPLPTEKAAQETKGVTGVVLRQAQSLTEMLPGLLLGGETGAGVQNQYARSLMSSLPLAFDEQGDFNPLVPIMAVGGHFADRAAQQFIRSTFFKNQVQALNPAKIRELYQRVASGEASPEEARVVDLINQKLKGEFQPGEMAGSTLAGVNITAPGRVNPMLQRAAEISGGVAAANTYMLGVQLPSILLSSDPKKSLEDAVSSQAALSILSVPGYYRDVVNPDLARVPASADASKIDVASPEVPPVKPVAPPAGVTPEGGANAPSTVVKQTGVPTERVGVDAVGKTGSETGAGNRVPSAAGERPVTPPLSPEQIDAVPAPSPKLTPTSQPPGNTNFSAVNNPTEDPNGKDRDHQNLIMARRREQVSAFVDSLPDGDYIVTLGGREDPVTIETGKKTGRRNTFHTTGGTSFDLKTDLSWGRATLPDGTVIWDHSTIRPASPEYLSKAIQPPATTLPPTMDTARKILAMSPEEFVKSAGSFNRINLAIGQNATPKDYEDLKRLRGLAIARLNEAIAVASKSGKEADLNVAAALGSMPQFYIEALRAYDEAHSPVKPPEPPTVPERPETIEAQVKMLTEGKKRVVMITPGEAMPTVPSGFRVLKQPEGAFIYHPDKVKPSEILKAIKSNTLGDLLGYGISSKPAAGTEIGAVVVRDPAGVEKHGVLTDAEHLGDVEKAAADVASPGDTITLEPEKEVIDKRKPAPAAPKSRPQSVRVRKQSEWKEIGKNSKGNAVFEDENGVRSYVEDNVRVTEAVRMVPTREGVKIGVKSDAERKGTDFEVVEKPAEKPTVKEPDVNQPAKSGSGDSGVGGELPAGTGASGAPQPASVGSSGAAETVQPPVRPPDEGPGSAGGTGSGGIVNAPANGVPGEPEPTAPLIPTAGTGKEGTGTVPPKPSESNPAPDAEVGEDRPRNIRLTENPAPTGPVARVKANLDAIALLKKLEAENRFPTEEERKVLAAWSGWGSFKELFNEGKAEKRDWDSSWMKRYGAAYEKLRKLLTPDEFNAAAESSVNAHYTSQDAVQAMWQLVRRLGYKGGRALESSTGSGVFVGYAPADLAATTRWTGAEMEPITGKIFSYLYPEVDMRIQPFENTKLPNGFYDLAMTNVPFHEIGPGKEYPDLNLHNYFIARMLDKTKPGGLVVVITTHNTMDARPEERAMLADKGQLVGAIRLPSNAFKESAATEVVTDILVLRKPDGKPFESARWTGTTEIETAEGPTRINEYFANNPHMVLGRNALTGTMYRKDSYTVEPTEGAITDKLAEAIKHFPENILNQERQTDIAPSETQLEEGTLRLDENGNVLEARNFLLEVPTWDTSSTIMVKRAKLYMGLRDILKEQYRLEDDPAATDDTIEANRAKLKKAYQSLVKEVGGTINQNDRKMGFLSTDPDFYTVMGVEVFREAPDPKNPGNTVTVVEPADVFTKRVKVPDVPPTRADSAADALGISLAYRGKLEMDYIRELTGLSEEQVEAELISSDLGFRDPESGLFVSAQDYLSGDVREKLAKAIFAAKESNLFDRNVESLKKVIPETVPFNRIKLGITARWIPPTVLNQFAKEVIGLNGDEIAFVPGIEEFAVKTDVSRYSRSGLSDKAKSQWSTNDMNAPELLRYALNFKRARIMRRTTDDKYVEDTDASALCNQIIDKMALSFQEWVRTTDVKVPYRFFDVDRGDYSQSNLSVWDVLEREFNRTKNSFVQPDTDGSLLRLPGLSTLVMRKPHLLNGVMRAIVMGSSVYGHGVGSGKTFLAVVAMHELKRIGLMKKGVMAIKKPTVAQFRVSIERAYPGSRVLMPNKKDFEPANRKKLAARIASGNWDFIILTHEQFKAIRTSEESVNAFFNDQIEQLRQILRQMGSEAAENAKSTRGMDPAVRNIVKKLKTLKKRLTAHTDAIKKKQDVGIEWQDLGIDGVWIDESHNFKKMPIPTQMDNVKGIPTDFSQRAVDLLIKIRDVQRRTNGRNVFFASGTPVSNTLAELWVMFHATNPQLLKQFSIETFDSFATTFADTVSNFELGWDNRFKDVTRMSRFKNGGALTMLTRMGMDVRMGNKELGLDVPNLENGKPKVVVVKTTKSFDRWLEMLDNISSTWDGLDKKGRFENSWVPIATMRAGVAAALDPRCVFPDAEDDANSKVNQAVRDIIAEWTNGRENKTTMMVFADMYRTLNSDKLQAFLGNAPVSVEPTEIEVDTEENSADSEDAGEAEAQAESAAFEANAVGRFNLYEDMRRKLVAAGIPENEIAIITEHDSDAKREALFNKVRSGSVRILFGSTEKIGEGVDVPQRMSAQFHLDPPMQMTPAKMEQRIGRIIRQGNLHSPKNWNLPVRLFMYAQEKSMDAAIYQMLETKGAMVIQAIKGQYLGDEFDDPASELTMAMAEMKAAATGDTRVLELAKLQKEVRELSLEEGAFFRRISELRREVEMSASNAQHQREESEKYTLLSNSMEKEMADKDAIVLTHKAKRYVGEKAINEFLEKARPAFEDALKVEGSKAAMHLKIGADVNVLVEGATRVGLNNKLVTKYDATFYLGAELNWGTPRWDSNLNTIESLLNAAAGVSRNAANRTQKAIASADESERLGKAYAEQFKNTKFERKSELDEKRSKLQSLESELRVEGARRRLKPGSPEALKSFESQTKSVAPPLHVRLLSQINDLLPAYQKTIQDQDRTVGRMRLAPFGSDIYIQAARDHESLQQQADKLQARIGDLERRLAVVEKARLGTSDIAMPYGVTESQGGKYYSPEATVESFGEEQIVRGLQQLSRMLRDPRSGLSDEARRVALALLNTPAMQNLDWSRLAVALRNNMHGIAGEADPAKWLINLSKGASPQTFPHEVFHFLWSMLPEEDQTHVELARQDAIAAEINAFTSGMPPEAVRLAMALRSGKMTSAQYLAELAKLKNSDVQAYEWFKGLYPLINPSEFLAGMAGRQFSAETLASENLTWFQKFMAMLRGWIQSIVDALRRIVGARPSMEQIYREILSGRNVAVPEDGALADGERRLSVEGDPLENAGVNAADLELEIEKAYDDAAAEGVKTEVLGRKDTVLGREGLSDAERAAGADYAKKLLEKAGLQVERDAAGLWKLSDETMDSEIEGRKLFDLLRQEIAVQSQPGAVTGYLGNLLNSVVVNMTTDGTTAFSPELRRDLYSIAQGERSHRGLLLASLAGFSKSVEYVARNVDVVLQRVYADAFGGDEIRTVMDRVLTDFRQYFTDKEIEDTLRDHEKLVDTVQKIIALNRRDEGGRVYRRAQALLKPKGKKKLARLEADARVKEAVDQIIEQLKNEGVEPAKSPNKPLSPLQRLLLMVEPKTAEKIDRAIANAIASAERNAGIKAALAAAGSEGERQDLMGRFSAGEEPDSADVEAGLNLPEYAHWKVLRDTLLDYSPTTLKLVRDLLKSDFSGTRFSKPRARKVDTRLDLEELAKKPDVEVQRALNAYAQNVEANMDLHGATPETETRILDMIHKDLSEQVEAVRKRLRDPLFAAPPARGQPVTPEQRMAQLINAGLFGDDRLSSRDMVERLAAKAPVQRLTPKIPDLVKQVFATPYYRQSELAGKFADWLTNKLAVTPAQAQEAAKVFGQAFAAKFALARQRALERAKAALSPQPAQKLNPRKPTWKKIEEAVNAGVFDTGAVLRQIAAGKGWWIPDDPTIAKIKDLAGKMQKMKELTTVERQQIGDNAQDVRRAQEEKEAASLEKRIAMKKQIETYWARMTQPLNLKTVQGRANLVDAIGEFESANLLFKFSFAPRQLIDVLTQGGLHTPTRAMQAAIDRWLNDRSASRDANLWEEINSAFKQAYAQRFAATRAALSATIEAFRGTGEARNVDRLMTRIAVFERAAQKADELQAGGKRVEAALLRMFEFVKFGYRVAQALDNLHGLPAEYQEMRQKTVTTLRENGMSKAEAETKADWVMGDMRAEWMMAIARVQQLSDVNGWNYKANEVKAAAWLVVKARQYQRMREIGLPADDFMEHNRVLRNTVGWNEREEGGIGGAVAASIRYVGKAARELPFPLGLPFVAVSRFGNAIGTSINRKLSFTPLGFFPEAFGKSPWYRSPEDRTQRKVEAAIGSTLLPIFFALALFGIVKVWLRPPRDPEERALWEREGHKAGTVEFPVGDGRFIPVSMTTGPLALFAEAFAAGGALHDLNEQQTKKQARLNDEAAKHGLTAGKVAPPNAGAYLGVAWDAAYSTLMGGRTASGLLNTITDYGVPNASKLVASVISPTIPGLPAAQEVTRMAGVSLDPKTASVADFLLPLPTSSAARKNMIGDPVGTDDAVQRITQIITGGTYGPITPSDAHAQAAYAALYSSGYQPPSINPARGYNIDGEIRPLTNNELTRYTDLRGQYFKEALTTMGATADPAAIKAAYQQANARALQAVGVNVETPAASSQSESRSTTTGPVISAAGVPSVIGRGNVRPSMRSTRSSRRVGRGGGRSRSGPTLRARGSLPLKVQAGRRRGVRSR